MRINVEIDNAALHVKGLKLQKRLAYAAAQALNDTALDVQLAQRANLDRKFTVRKHSFFYRLVKIQFASVKKDRAFAEIFIDQKPRLLLSKFERGGVKEPLKGKNVAVPLTGSPARPSFRNPVTRALTFQQLKIRAYRTKGGKRQWKGQQRTFLIPDIGVFQREQGKSQQRSTVSFKAGKSDVSFAARSGTTKMLYRFTPKPLLKATLEFDRVAGEVFRERWKANFARRFNG